MAERIMITPQELFDGATFLRDRLANINQEVSSLKSKVDAVCSDWEGESQRAFVNQFESEVYPVLHEKLPMVIEGISKQLDTIAQNMIDADIHGANSIRG